MRFILTPFIFLFLLIPLANASAYSVVEIGAPTDVLEDYYRFLDGRNPLEITNYSGPHSRRDVVEVVLFQQALALGGLGDTIRLTPVPTYKRLVAELHEGSIAATGTSLWLHDLKKDEDAFAISEAIIEEGQFEAGLYTSLGNPKAQRSKTLDKVRQLTAVCNKDWIPDWRTLKSLDLKKLTHIQSWKAMVRVVATGRSDFLLAPFQQTEDMLLHVDDMTLSPIRGIKVALVGTRHFAVSQKHPLKKRIDQALRRGIRIMKKNETFKKAYRQSGFFNIEVKDWLTLETPASAE